MCGRDWLWVRIICPAFFGFLRAGKMTVPDDREYDKSVHFGFDDIAVDNPSSPSFVRVRIKQSKTDLPSWCQPIPRSYSHGFVPRSGTPGLSCRRGAGPGRLFKFVDGRPLIPFKFLVQL
jgi:hypothetical protein